MELFIIITMYNEDDAQRLEEPYLCERDPNKTWGKED